MVRHRRRVAGMHDLGGTASTGRSMTDKVRVGLIGTSGWVEQMYVPSLRSHPGAEVVAVCGRNAGPAGTIAAKFGGARVFAD